MTDPTSSDPAPGVLNTDDPAATVTMPDGRVVANLSAEQYAATYADAEPHTIPADVLAQALAEAARIAEQSGAGQ